MDGTQRQRHRAGGSSYHRTPLVEIDDNSFEVPCHIDRGRISTAMSEKTQTRASTLTASGVASQEKGSVVRTCNQKEGKRKSQAQSVCSIPPGNVQQVVSCKKTEVERKSWREDSHMFPGPTDIQDLSALMESTCLTTSPRTPRPDEVRVENLLAGDHDGCYNLAENQSNQFDVTTFHPPSSSTPLGRKRTQCVSKEEGDSDMKNSGTVGRYNKEGCTCTCVSLTQLPVELSSAGRTLDNKETRGYKQCIQKNNQAEHISTALTHAR